MEKTSDDYPQDITTISKKALLEVVTMLKGYKEHIVLVGGWVPYFLLKKYQKDKDFKHVGSVDIDLVIDPELIATGVYDTIISILEKNGFSPREDKKGNPIEFSFEKEYDGQAIHIDFLSTNYPEKTKKRHRMVQPDLKARTLKGATIALKHNYEEELEGELPNGAHVKVKLKIADVIGCLATKAIALGDRSVAKDHYDIYAIISYYKDGEESCAEEMKKSLGEEDIKESLEEIRKNFEQENSLGPTFIGGFLHSEDEDAKKRIMTDAYMRVNRFLELLE